VFAESDMIHKQQMGYCTEDIIMGLCESLVRNFLNNLAKGKAITGPVVFQGGVAANAGMKRAFEAALDTEVVIPPYHHVMGALGSAILAKEYVERTGRETAFKGFETSQLEYKTSSFYCKGCANNCEIAKIEVEGEVLARFGSRCGKWEVDSAEKHKSMDPVFVIE
jgi:predicted NodU family carbamoyl transferase